MIISDCTAEMPSATKQFSLRRGLDGCGTIHHEVCLWSAPITLRLDAVCQSLRRTCLWLNNGGLRLVRVCLHVSQVAHMLGVMRTPVTSSRNAPARPCFSLALLPAARGRSPSGIHRNCR